MRFDAFAIGFDSEEELKEKLEFLREGHVENIGYIDGEGKARFTTVEAVGIFDYYYKIDGYSDLKKLLDSIKHLGIEERIDHEFKLDYLRYDSLCKSTSYTLSSGYFIIINTPGWTPFWASYVPGAVKGPRGTERVIYVKTPITYVERSDLNAWETLKYYYRVANNSKLTHSLYPIFMHC